MKNHKQYIIDDKSTYEDNAKANLLNDIEFETIYNLFIKVIEKLKLKRHLWNNTDEYLKDLRKEIIFKDENHYWMFASWILNSIKDDETFVYAYNYLVKENNKKNGYEGYKTKNINRETLAILLEEEHKPDVRPFKFNTALIEKVFDNSVDEVFHCEKGEFFRYVETANFSELEIKIKYKFKILIFLLSKSMHKDWYKLASKSIGLTPTKCSKVGDRENVWFRKMEKIFTEYDKIIARNLAMPQK